MLESERRMLWGEAGLRNRKPSKTSEVGVLSSVPTFASLAHPHLNQLP